jgi:hypothetical protein
VAVNYEDDLAALEALRAGPKSFPTSQQSAQRDALENVRDFYDELIDARLVDAGTPTESRHFALTSKGRAALPKTEVK